jgi:carbonic anhydrase
MELPTYHTEEALRALREGNRRFAAGRAVHPHQDAARREEILPGQRPFAVILACSDSRVPPEIIFDQGLGDLFVVRTAGDVVDDVALGSIEYAVEHLGVPLVVVLGHTRCGAVTATLHGDEVSGHIAAIVQAILPAVQEARRLPGDPLSNAIDAHIRHVVAYLRATSPILAEREHAGTLRIVGARYNLENGEVEWM